jgi:hypothetical protein
VGAVSTRDVLINYRDAADSMYEASLLYAELSHALGPNHATAYRPLLSGELVEISSGVDKN